MTEPRVGDLFKLDHPDTQDHLLNLAIAALDTGWLEPITVSKRTGVIIDGNHRYTAWLKYGQEYKLPKPQIIELDLDELDAEVNSFKKNIHRRMNDQEKTDRIIRVCLLLLEKNLGLLRNEAFSTAYYQGKIPLEESYARNLCPKEFKEETMARISSKSGGQVPAIPLKLPENLVEAVQLGVEARDQGQDHGLIFTQKDPKTDKAFHQLIQNPKEFWHKFHRGEPVETLVELAIKPKEEITRQTEYVRQTLSHAPGDEAWINRDEDGLKYRTFVIKKEGQAVRFEGELL